MLSPDGDGIDLIIFSIKSSIPMSLLALTWKADFASIPIISSISFSTRLGSDDGRSILFSTGITSRFKSIAL